MAVSIDPTARLLVFVLLGIVIVLGLAMRIVGRARRREFAIQVAWITPAWLAYFAVRGVTQADPGPAIARARELQEVEQAVGLHIGPWLNDRLASSDLLTATANIVYIWGHWPLILAVAIWLFWRHPEVFHRYKRAFLVSGAIGLTIFYLLPTAPPRLADAAYLDTVTEYSRSYRVLQPPLLTNQYAAFPSLHVGWNLLIGIALVRTATFGAARLLGLLSPVAMGLAAVATANHYVLDLVAGAIVALVGLAVASGLAREIATRWFPGAAAQPELGGQPVADRSVTGRTTA